MLRAYLLKLLAVESSGQICQLRVRLQANRVLKRPLALQLQLTHMEPVTGMEQRQALLVGEARLEGAIHPFN